MTPMEDERVRQDMTFYYWTGMVLYASSAALSIIHLYQLKGRQPVDFAFILVLFSINVSLLVKIRSLKNWARNAYLARIVLFVLFFYPILIFGNDEWAYSKHWPHGILQRVCNFSILVYEIYFVFFLLRRSTRYAFLHSSDGLARRS